MIKHLSIQDNPLFPELNVLVMVGGDEKYWSKFFADQDDHFHEAAIHGEVKLFKPDDHDGYCKFTQLYKDGWMGDVPCIIIHFPEATFDHAYAPDVFSSAIIGHECLHAAQFIMEHYEISYSEKEFFARIQQWLFKAIAEWVEEQFFQDGTGLTPTEIMMRLNELADHVQRGWTKVAIIEDILKIQEELKGG